MSKWYGNVNNRLEEGRNYTGREIQVGDNITEYLWSDRHCYYVTAVENQKRIKVKPYIVVHDHSKEWYMGNQDWVYFKSVEEADAYLRQFGKSYTANVSDEETWVFRYGKWMTEFRHDEMRYPDAYSKREREHFAKHGWFNTYHDLSGKVSFGVCDYYYDWEF